MEIKNEIIKLINQTEDEIILKYLLEIIKDAIR